MKLFLGRLNELMRYLMLHVMSTGFYLRRYSKLPRAGERVVVSLTTIPSRIQRTLPVIRSILDQSVAVHEISLNLPRQTCNGESYIIPDFLRKIPVLQIREINTDLGPATKSLPTIKREDPGTLIVVIDDDQVYPRDLIRNYLNQSRQYENVVMCLCGWKVSLKLSHFSREIISGAALRIFGTRSGDLPQEVDIIQGTSSYTLRPAFFRGEVFDYDNAPKEAFFVDDIWISGHLAKNGIRKVVIPGSFSYARLEVLGTRSIGLVRTANRSHQNNDRMYQFFKEYWIFNR